MAKANDFDPADVSAPATLASGPKMFRKRVIQGQNRVAEWRGLLKKLSKEIGGSPNEIAKEARKAMGYEGVHRERALYIEWLEKRGSNAKQRERNAKGKVKTFEYALSRLPEEGDPQKAIQWIQNHPAMARKARSESVKPIVLTAEDILSPSHGPAPSRAAATSLQNWVNKPEEFFKAILSEQKKSTGKEQGIKDAAAELSIQEMEEMIAAIQG